MKIQFRYIMMTVLGAVCLAVASSCAKWTEPESIPIIYPNIIESNPALYEEYLSAIREYRDSEHKVLIAKFDNKATAPGGRGEHINCLPDSTDYVILSNPDNLHPVIAEEMKEIREKKGIRTLYSISCETIAKAYESYLKEWNAAHPEPEIPEASAAEEEGAAGEPEEPVVPEEPAEVPMTEEEFVLAQIDVQLSYFDKYGYDGIVMGYVGFFPESMTGETLDNYRAGQARIFDKFNDFFASRPDKLLFFEGMPINVIYDAAFFDRCKFIIADATDAVNRSEIDYLTTMALGNRIPLDRIVTCVAAPSLDDPKDTRGLFTGTDANGNSPSAIVGAGEWAAEKSEFYTRAGICVMRSQNDYWHTDKVYGRIREAISIMNPSPLN